MPFLLEEARTNVELLLGWSVLPKYGRCCTGLVTEETWKRLQARLHLDVVPLSRHRSIGHHVQRLYAACLGPVTHLANVPPNAILPALWFYGNHRPSSQPLRRARVEHITPWSRPIGRRRAFRRLQDAFLTHGFDHFVTQTEAEPIQPGLKSWRQITHRPFGGSLCAEFSTTTVRFLWRGFHVELTEQKRTIFDLSSDDCASTSNTASTSRGKRRSWTVYLFKNNLQDLFLDTSSMSQLNRERLTSKFWFTWRNGSLKTRIPMYCSSKLHTSTLPSQSQLASQLSSPVRMLRSYCHFQFTVLEVIFLTMTYLSENWVVGIPEPVCAQKEKSVDSCSRILAPGVTSSDQSVLLCLLTYASTLLYAFFSLLLWRPCSSAWKLVWVGNPIPVGRIWQSSFLFFILFTLGVLLGLVLGMPRGPSAVPGMTEPFLAYPFKKFRTTWKPACFGRGNGYKAFTQLAREAYRCVPVRAWRCAGASFLCDGSVFSQMSRSSRWGPSTPPESVLLRRYMQGGYERVWNWTVKDTPRQFRLFAGVN